MNTLLARIGAVVLALGLMYGMGYWRGHASNATTVTQLRSDMRAADVAADAVLKAANGRTRDVQRKLDATISNLNNLQGEFNATHSQNDQLRVDLAASRKRLSVAIAPGSCGATGHGAGAAVAAVDTRTPIAAELDPTVAANLVELTDIGDQAIRRLNACIAAYDAVSAAK